MYQLVLTGGSIAPYNTELYHHGILGQKWGVRRFQKEDGTLTSAGKKRKEVSYNSHGQLDSYKDYKRANKYAAETLKAKNKENTKKFFKGEQKLGVTLLKNMANHQQYVYEKNDNEKRMSMKARGERVASNVIKSSAKKAAAIGAGVAGVKLACSVGNATVNAMIKGKYGNTALSTIGNNPMGGRYEFSLDKGHFAKAVGQVALTSLAISVASEATSYARSNDSKFNKTGNYTLDKQHSAQARKDREKWKKGEV